MSVYIPYMNLLHSIMLSQAEVYIHFTLLAYVLVQICLQYCTYISHCISTVRYLHEDPILLLVSVQTQQNVTSIYDATAIHVPATNIPLKYHKDMPNTQMCQSTCHI